MFLGREIEMNQLATTYKNEGSEIVILYGEKQIGKTTLLHHFLKDKTSNTYYARCCSEREQKYQWRKEFELKELEEFPKYTEILHTILSRADTYKQVLVIENFEYILKEKYEFIEQLLSVMEMFKGEREIMVILVSSASRWIEHQMPEKLPEIVQNSFSLLKLTELRYQHLVKCFPGFSQQETIEAYAVFGGHPGLWSYLNPDIGFTENIIRNILNKHSLLFHYAQHFIQDELREPAVYNTILRALATGNQKLNDMHLHTDFSRAKISVYLKHLMELEVVNKITSTDIIDDENAKKGVYEFSNNFIHFYYAFLYPYSHKLDEINATSFYNFHVAPYLSAYVQYYFSSVCSQYLFQQNIKGRLPISYVESGKWVGKLGKIDVVAKDEDGQTLVAFCEYKKSVVSCDDYDKYLAILDSAKIKADHIFLFTAKRFEDNLKVKSKSVDNLTLVAIRG